LINGWGGWYLKRRGHCKKAWERRKNVRKVDSGRGRQDRKGGVGRKAKKEKVVKRKKPGGSGDYYEQKYIREVKPAGGGKQ